ncbi:MAG: hypothetical protein PHN49_10445 [Candidatus Omnitrophica bacterium]|nr:hypothetical protein [Candidatus Omnitrophota bacterium]MDD5672049.1 hypothetical protein [Candidatus Omnitrophota bacterium]
MSTKTIAKIIKALETQTGEWRLDDHHEISYRVRGRNKEASLIGSLVAAEPEALVLAVTIRESEKRSVTGLVKLAGRWSLDEKNRIVFYVKRDFGQSDKLTFRGAWEVNRNHEVVYTYSTRRISKDVGINRQGVRRCTHELVFKGHWEIANRRRLTYSLGASVAATEGGEATVSAFRFLGSFESARILSDDEEIRYQVSMECKLEKGAARRVERSIILSGKWKIARDFAISFELKNPDGHKSQITVSADVTTAGMKDPMNILPDEISLKLTGRTGKTLGLELVLSKDFFKGNVRTFIRFVRSMEESRIETGLAIA